MRRHTKGKTGKVQGRRVGKTIGPVYLQVTEVGEE